MREAHYFTHRNYNRFYPQFRTYLCQVGNHIQGDVSIGFMKVPADHIDPRGTVPRVAVCFIKSHDVCKIGKFGVLLFQTNLLREESQLGIQQPDE